MQMILDGIPASAARRKEKVLQFGEGNFVRAFIDWMIDQANRQGVYDGAIVICQPIPQGHCDIINRQEGRYTVVIRDIEDGRLIEETVVNTSVSRCINPYVDYEALLDVGRSEDLEVIISNTTEKGIVYVPEDCLTDQPPSSFPAKMTALLYERYRAFKGDNDKGLLIIPLELIDDNGKELKEIMLRYSQEWGLEQGFIRWFLESNHIVSTLVDRIVTGYPHDSEDYFRAGLGYHDELLDTCERYNLLAIEGPEDLSDRLPIHKTQANVIWTEDITPYRKRKLYILNGAHNAMGLAAYLAGHRYVIDVMEDEVFGHFTRKVIYNEIVPNFDESEAARAFATDVLKRFENPYIHHNLLQIAIHGCSKFQLRCMPSILTYQKRTGRLPKLLVFSFAAFLAFYKGERTDRGYYGIREDGEMYEIKDSPDVVDFFDAVWHLDTLDQTVHAVLSNTDFWAGMNLTMLPGLEVQLADMLSKILEQGVRQTMKELLEG